MVKILAFAVVLVAVAHGIWAERQRLEAKRWQGIATTEDLEAREVAVLLRLDNSALEAELRQTKERVRELRSALLRRQCILGEVQCCF